MKMKEVYELTDRDKQLLSSMMIMPSKSLLAMRRDPGYCGSPEEAVLEKSWFPYKDAGIFDFMYVKMKLIEVLHSLNDSESCTFTISEIRKRCNDYLSLPKNVREAMDMKMLVTDDINTKLIQATSIDKLLKDVKEQED